MQRPLRRQLDLTADFVGRISFTTHSPPDGRQAVPRREAVDAPARVAEKARQISSSLTKGVPVGVKVPFMDETGLSQETWVPGPCGSSATASAALARRQSSSSRSGERGI